MQQKFYTISLGLLLSVVMAWAQTDETDYYSLTLEELMNIEIVSASKKSESLFDAPLSASVLTREEIRKAGPTSIMEALRLIPGVIVREQTNGNYDIHVRGLDNIPPNSLLLSSTNTTTLVMINNRPVYNYLQGGTFWESLPIDLNDVEKIEVVRGPSSTLYGPNSVSGVINIITNSLQKNGLSVNGSTQYGTLNTAVTNVSAGYQFNDKFSIILSGNHQMRGRDERYLDLTSYTWVNDVNQLPFANVKERYPDPDKSMIKYGLNSFMQYKAKEKIELSLSAGLQDAQIQNTMFDNSTTPISTATTKSGYVDFKASTYGLNTQLSFTSADQSPVIGMTGSKYTYQVTDLNMEYEFNIKALAIKPTATYRSATYDDSKFWNIAIQEGAINGKKTIETLGLGVRLDYKMLQEKLRLTGGMRLDKFTHPDDYFVSYQAASSYKINDNNLVRVVYSKAYRSPFIFDTYINYALDVPLGNDMSMRAVASGNKDLALLNSTMIELGYRTKIKDNISLDIEAYKTRTENYTALIQKHTSQTPENYPIVAFTELEIQNIPLSVDQLGTSLSLNFVLNKLQIKPFVTFQKTTLNDYSPYLNTGDATPSPNNENDPANHNLNSGKGLESNHKFTPKAYGGAFINYNISAKFNLNVNSYWFGKQTFYEADNLVYKDGVRGVGNFERKIHLNAKLTYTPVKAVTVFVNGRNLLNQKSREYYNSDLTPAMILGGLSFQF